ncbi:MAG TPA: hypothetical protein VMR73_02100 [Candidatus Paceibacterota bacterium]|nr:hypothetical protein [Candidatus Paceibacterota bacterium]
MKEQKQQSLVGSEVSSTSRNVGPASVEDILGGNPEQIAKRNEAHREQRKNIFRSIREGPGSMAACVSGIVGASVTYHALHR